LAEISTVILWSETTLCVGDEDMKNKTYSRTILSVTIILFSTIALLLFAHGKTLGDTAPWPIKEHQGAYTLIAMPGKDGKSVDVYVNADLHSPKSLQKYVEALKKQLSDLATSSKKDIPVMITFSHPMSVKDARALTRECNVDVSEFLVVGHEDGKPENRGGGIHLRSLDAMTEEEIMAPEPMGPNMGDIIFSGVMVLKGVVATGEGLKCLDKSPDVYFVDTMALEASNLLEAQYPEQVSGKELNITLETPFWSLDW